VEKESEPQSVLRPSSPAGASGPITLYGAPKLLIYPPTLSKEFAPSICCGKVWSSYVRMLRPPRGVRWRAGTLYPKAGLGQTGPAGLPIMIDYKYANFTDYVDFAYFWYIIIASVWLT
jgi:hypothetical protein